MSRARGEGVPVGQFYAHGRSVWLKGQQDCVWPQTTEAPLSDLKICTLTEHVRDSMAGVLARCLNLFARRAEIPTRSASIAREKAAGREAAR